MFSFPLDEQWKCDICGLHLTLSTELEVKMLQVTMLSVKFYFGYQGHKTLFWVSRAG